ncbi:acyl-coenzyme A thioesterase 13-like [Xenia sp. Carnegie-2017]|uniref:acyl-coenzyme A thioesterase 13-like n=1 Tax=Xenia sp. Carnegie-2017 TaxID=2897299 RepID=UPI001F0456B8|nr:acyl-coenzyme A thioesterase 13-like [Xenia sp. Carnegie-2017]
MSTLDKIRRIYEVLETQKKFDRVLKKVKIVAAEPGKVVAELIVEEEHQNASGTLHGGFTATLIDVLTSLALVSGENGRPGVSVDLNVMYIGTAKIGDLVTITAEALKVGRTMGFATAELKLPDGKLVARANHTKHLGPSL